MASCVYTVYIYIYKHLLHSQCMFLDEDSETLFGMLIDLAINVVLLFRAALIRSSFYRYSVDTNSHTIDRQLTKTIQQIS